jgi:hypothetical protein
MFVRRESMPSGSKLAQTVLRLAGMGSNVSSRIPLFIQAFENLATRDSGNLVPPALIVPFDWAIRPTLQF